MVCGGLKHPQLNAALFNDLSQYRAEMADKTDLRVKVCTPYNKPGEIEREREKVGARGRERERERQREGGEKCLHSLSRLSLFLTLLLPRF